MTTKFYLDTEHPGAFDSQDHLNPVGSLNDNYTNIELLKDVCNHFKKKINMLDLGCAGGQFAIDFINFGNNAVGLEGSTHVLNGPGKNNWSNFSNNLFFCDITKSFTILSEDRPAKFEFIHCSEVMEHLSEKELEIFLENVYNHLSDDGIFCTQISIDNSDPLHVSIFSKNKWQNILSEHKLIPCDGINDNYQIGYLFNRRFRDHIIFNYDGTIKTGTSLYFCLKKNSI
jgi:SAM-dependent methyltransferase